VPFFVEIYPDTWTNGDEDEYVRIGWDGIPGEYVISDGEGSITVCPPGGDEKTCTIARNAAVFREVFGTYPDYEILDGVGTVPQVQAQGKFQLSNRKDELALSQHGTVYDSASWPGTFKSRKGQIHFCASDKSWDQRILMAGGSRLVPQTFHNISGLVSVSPDCSRQVLEDVIRSAKEKILLNVYEFTDSGIAQLLVDAKHRGVLVHVLLEGGPVGGIPAEEFSVIHTLNRAGVTVMIMDGEDENHPPYRYNHAKYIVLDNRQIFLTTENFKEHSFPVTGHSGNRGWSVLLASPELATYFGAVFLDDYDGPGMVEAEGRQGSFDEQVVDSYHPVFTPLPFSGATITPVFSPDTSHLIADMINQSSSRVWIQQAYITEYPKNASNPFLAAAVNAARRGVDVRILLDGYYYNIEGDKDNDEMVTTLSTLAARENISLQAKVLYPERTGLLKVHTKGVIADDQVLVSSMNWNENSACFNREAGVIIQNREAASYFASVYLIDWSGVRNRQLADDSTTSNDTEIIRTISLMLVIVILILIYRRYHR